MKRIKSVGITSLILLGAFSLITYSACTKDECDEVICQNGGTCAGGLCTCPVGYLGYQCEIESRALFLREWVGRDLRVGGGTVPLYRANVRRIQTSVPTMLQIDGFSDSTFDHAVIASVASKTITIDLQEPDKDSVTVEGSGLLSADTSKIDWNYTITGKNGVAKTYNGTWRRD
jgi:hypothetical protein